MFGSLLIALVVFVLGERASDALEVRQQEVVLQKLPADAANAYYGRLRRRARKIGVLRAVIVASLMVLGYAYRRELVSERHGPARNDGAEEGMISPAPAPAR